jgi:hypothetical protein
MAAAAGKRGIAGGCGNMLGWGGLQETTAELLMSFSYATIASLMQPDIGTRHQRFKHAVPSPHRWWQE